MIVQQINLYQDRFRDKRQLLSAVNIAAALLLVIAACAVWSFLLQTGLHDEQRRNRAVKAEREQLSAELAVANAELARLLEDKRIDTDIDETSRQISARRKVLNFVDANRFGSGEGFSAYLVALSKLHQDEIWLKRIHLAENFMQISGSSLDAGRVPEYFDRFSDEAIFRGNRFELFELSRDAEHEWKVDFEIATSGVADE